MARETRRWWSALRAAGGHPRLPPDGRGSGTTPTSREVEDGRRCGERQPVDDGDGGNTSGIALAARTRVTWHAAPPSSFKQSATLVRGS